MQTPTWLRPPKGVHWTPRLAVALTLVVISGALAFKGAASLLFALLTFGGDVDPSAALENSLKKHEQLAKVDRDRFDGRSAFFKPPEPVRNIPKPPPPPKVEKPLPPPEPVIPAEYGGKRPTSVLGSIVFFDNFQIKVGEQENGIKVIATNAPWSVKLGYEGGEYDVPLWSQSKETILNGKWPTKSTPGIESSTRPVVGKDINVPDASAIELPAPTAHRHSVPHPATHNLRGQAWVLLLDQICQKGRLFQMNQFNPRYHLFRHRSKRL